MENYNVLMVLGEGSFDRVLLVHNKSTSQKYAMKEIKCPKSVFNIEKTWNESIILAKTIHPNIVIYAVSFEADGLSHIVMDYCDGRDLLQKISKENIKFQKEKLFPENMILKGLAQMCLENVFLTQNGKMKLEDFESAVLLKCPMAYICSFVGNPYYTPPEI
uniref:Protein kinase domain-containing protein n=1 Tax=Naja naja TaxID=35670 RepID=A0A8C6YMX2_NAJNA